MAADTLSLIKQQFSDLCAQRDAALAVSEPLRGQRDALVANALASVQAQVDAINGQIAAAEVGLPDLMNQIATIATALNGKTSTEQ